MKTFRIVKDGITPGCPIYRIDEKKLFYWQNGATEFAPNYKCTTIYEAVKKIREKYLNAKIYIDITNINDKIINLPINTISNKPRV